MTLFEGLTALPAHGLVDYGGGLRLAGYIEETEVAGTKFLSVTPPGRHPVLINAVHVVSIHPCDEDQAKKVAARQGGTPP